MRILLGLLGLFFALGIFSQATMAIEPKNIVPLAVTPPIVEPATRSNIPAKIISNWDVEEFTRENGFPTGECIMRADYDNDLEITFKGKNGQLSAVRIRDLSGGKASINGFSSLGLGKNSYGLQSRSKPGQIDASLLTVPAPAQKIMDLGEYKLRISKQDYSFDAGEFAYAYYELMKCTGYENAKTLSVVSQPRSRTTPLKKAVNVPSLPAEPIDLVVEQDIDVQPTAQAAPIVQEPENKDSSLQLQTWIAFKGGTVSSALKDWASQAGVNANIDLLNDVTLKEDIRVFGSLDVAVDQLLERTMGTNKPFAMIEDRNGELATISDVDLGVSAQKFSEKSVSTNNWRALQGVDLRKLLKRWSAREGIGFVWIADQSFLVKETLKSETNYNNAVEQLLSQFDSQAVRPVATLNVDPKTNMKTLIVNVLSAS